MGRRSGYWQRGTPSRDRKSTRLNSSHQIISYAVFCLKKTNITEEVIKRAKDKYHHNQTPTLNGYVEGGVYLPKFRNKIKISPQMLEVPKYPELSSVSFPIPELQFKEKEQEKIINEMISFVVSGRQTQQIATQEIIFERFCSRLIKKLNEDWERIFIEDGSNVSEIPNSVAKLEAASFQFILLGGV